MKKEDAYSLFVRGKELLKSNNPAQASTVLERAKKLQPKKGSIREALGQAYYNCQKYDLAKQEFSKVVQIDPSNHYAYFGLGLTYEKLGNSGAARKNLKIALAMEPNNQDYQKAWQGMGQLAKVRKLKLIKRQSPINVKCYSGYKAEQTPKSFEFKNQWHAVAQIDKSWQEENEETGERKISYRVLTDKGKVFDISYNEVKDVWLLEQELKH